jgi:hypothetical protein
MVLTAGTETALIRFSLPVHVTWTLLPAGLLIAGGLLTCGLLLLFDPPQRSLYSVLTLLLAISALKTSHLGGYLVGTLLGLAGGATAFSWVPDMPAGRAVPAGFRLIIGEADRRAGSHAALRPVPQLPVPQPLAADPRQGRQEQRSAATWPGAVPPGAVQPRAVQPGAGQPGAGQRGTGQRGTAPPWPPAAPPWSPAPRPAPRRHRARPGPGQAQPAWYRARQPDEQARERDRD